MKTSIANVILAGALLMAAPAMAQVPAENKLPVNGADSTQTTAGKAAPAKPRKIARGGCYYPFPIEENDREESVAREFSYARGAEYLDGLTRQWTGKVGCVTCHTTLPYYTCRLAMGSVPGSAEAELRELMEYRVAHWDSEKPLWDAEVLITAVSMVVHDSTTGKLQPETRTALGKMWSLQRENGAWNWLKAGTPPFEHDDYYGAVLVAVGLSYAPEDYLAEEGIKDGMARLRQYLVRTPLPSLHHAAWLMWANARMGGFMTNEVRDRKVSELMARQRADGGWSLPSLGGWKGHDGLPIDEAPSDGYGTGLVVFALRQAGLAANHESVRKGAQWLKANQRESGSWFTGSLGTRYHLNFISHSGSAFALMALKACE